MRLIFLGTAAGAATSSRNVSGMALVWQLPAPELWLIDCGEGTQLQLRRAGIKAGLLTKIFITHMHGDHLFGLMPLLTTLSLRHTVKELTVFGPRGLRDFIAFNLAATHSELSFKLTVQEFTPAKAIWQDNNFNIRVYRLYHRCQSYALRITYNSAAGDKIITVFGDTAAGPNEITAAQNADLAVHEATYAENLRERAELYRHSTGADAAKMAARAAVKKLILTHISARYATPAQTEIILREARALFPDTALASDFSQYENTWEEGGNKDSWQQLLPQ